VNELRQLLNNMGTSKDPNKKREVIKKVIAYMTLGIDVSKLYPDMVKISRTDDVVVKKMIFLYLTNYAE
jgi:vesicle coat complex subunit